MPSTIEINGTECDIDDGVESPEELLRKAGYELDSGLNPDDAEIRVERLDNCSECGQITPTDVTEETLDISEGERYAVTRY